MKTKTRRFRPEPHPNVKMMPNDGDLVDFIPSYAADPALQRKLLVENPERLFGFDKVI